VRLAVKNTSSPRLDIDSEHILGEVWDRAMDVIGDDYFADAELSAEKQGPSLDHIGASSLCVAVQ